jgi:hypothetical protein
MSNVVDLFKKEEQRPVINGPETLARECSRLSFAIAYGSHRYGDITEARLTELYDMLERAFIAIGSLDEAKIAASLEELQRIRAA